MEDLIMATKKIMVFGGSPPCAKCKNVEKVLNEAVKELGLDAQVIHVSALSDEADKYDIMLTPSVVINEKVVIKGRVPTKEDVKKILQEELK
ncbi:MAG TPA: thioredoxin family protein [Candidatus Methanomethylicus sp.]|mgnify:CR=1 FL=1|nr:thioredoxin family protein [Candidatus Methanomethylicus sp.]